MQSSVDPQTSELLDPPGCRQTGCGWYHGAWPVLRALGLVATPYRNQAFFESAIGAAAVSVGPRILCSGAADEAMPRLALDAAAAEGAEVALTVLDRCATPVERICGAVPGARGIVADVLGLDGPQEFDVVCSHGLLPTVPGPDRARLARAWASLLVDGGRVVTTTSLRPVSTDTQRFTNPGAFADQARERASSIDPATLDALGCSLDDVSDLARRWAGQVAADPIRSVEEVRSILEPVGFSVDVNERVVDGTVRGAASGPWSARTARYAEIVATKVPR